MGKVAGAVAKKAKGGASGKKKYAMGGNYDGSNMALSFLKKNLGKKKAAAPAAPAPAPRRLQRRMPNRYMQP